MVARICLPLVSLCTALRSGWRPSPHALSLRMKRSRPRTLQQRYDMYGLEHDDKMQTCISWSTSRAVPMSCTELEMRCDAENDIQMQVGAAADDVRVSAPPSRARWRPPLCAVPRRLRVVLARRSAARPRAFRQPAVHRRVRLQRAHDADRRLAAAHRRLVRLVWRRPVGGARRGVARATVPLLGLRQPRPVTRVPRLAGGEPQPEQYARVLGRTP